MENRYLQSIKLLKKTLIPPIMALLLVFGANLSNVKAQIILQDDFEKASLDNNIWDVTWWTPDGQLSEGIEPEIVDSPVRTGNNAVKIRAQANWNGHTNYSRTEILGKRNDTKSFVTFFYPGKEYWIGFSIYLSDDWETDNTSKEVVFQLHGNGGGGQYQIPPFALIVDGDDWYWGISSDVDPTPDEADEFGRVALTKGEWVDFVIHAKFSYSYDGYGFYEIWKNDTSLFTRNGPNCYNDERKIRGPQTGIYKWDWSQSGEYDVSQRIMYLDAIKVGGENSSYADVAPSGDTTIISTPVVDKNTNFSIFPNPSKGIVNISTDMCVDDLTVTIYNCSAQSVKIVNFQNTNKVSLDLSVLSNGIYVLRFDNKDELLGTYKISIV